MELGQHAPAPIAPGAPREHALGPPDAPVALLEYGDFDCRHCRRVYGLLRALLDSLGDELRLVFRHFPLVGMHAHAELAAEAAEAAAAQGAFWPMHDLLFKYQEAHEIEDLLVYAGDLGLDLARFEDELRGRKHAPHVGEDVAEGRRSGVIGTPTLFVNGARYEGPLDYESLLEILEARESVARWPAR